MRVLLMGLIAVAVVGGLALVALTVGSARKFASLEEQRVNVLAGSTDTCVTCHVNATPGIVEQYGHSTMAAAKVGCRDCHQVAADYPGAKPHMGTHVLGEPTTAMCQRCHGQQVAQFLQSRHALPSYVAYAGTPALNEAHLAQYRGIPEATDKPNRQRNALFALEGPEITRFACRACHDVGKPAADGSVGQCSKCHLRHEFSLEQVRKPETCNACHIGPDHPQWEIYQESAHGIAYATGGHRWNWDAKPGTLTVKDFPAPTCATCHFSGFGASATTHDVGDRLTWYLFAPISGRRPAWQDNRTRMQNVCRSCHNENFIADFYQAADKATVRVNAWVKESDALIAPLKEQGLLTDAPFDEPIDFTHFNLWHHWGRTAKFGVWMQGPDYTQWHGAYEILHEMARLRKMVREKLERAGR